jgi:hypothetical protein
MPTLGTWGKARQKVLEGNYVPPEQVDQYTKLFLKHLKQPESIWMQGDYPTTMPVERYQWYWEKPENKLHATLESWVSPRWRQVLKMRSLVSSSAYWHASHYFLAIPPKDGRSV